MKRFLGIVFIVLPLIVVNSVIAEEGGWQPAMIAALVGVVGTATISIGTRLLIP